MDSLKRSKRKIENVDWVSLLGRDRVPPFQGLALHRKWTLGRMPAALLSDDMQTPPPTDNVEVPLEAKLDDRY